MEIAVLAAASQRAQASNSRAMDELKAELGRWCVWQSLRLTQLTLWSSRSMSPSCGSVDSHVGTPKCFAGDPESCRPFLISCALIFFFPQKPQAFHTESAKVAFAMNHLTGRALLWGTADWERQSPACSAFETFSLGLRKVFFAGLGGPRYSSWTDVDVSGRWAVGRLCHQLLHQGPWEHLELLCLVWSFCFRTSGLNQGWNVSSELPPSLDGFIELATHINLCIWSRIWECDPWRSQPSRLSWSAPAVSKDRPPGAPDSGPEPMQGGLCARLTPEDCCRWEKQLCLYRVEAVPLGLPF